MSPAKQKPEPPPGPRLEQVGDAWRVVYDERRYRFLLDDGRTADVIAIHDDSDLRAMVLEATGAKRIEGVARCPMTSPPNSPGT